MLRILVSTLLALSAVLAGAPHRAVTAILSPAERDEALRARGVDPALRPDPLEISEELRRTAVRVAGSGDPTDRLQRLQRFLFDDREFLFDYEASSTLSAKEAFKARRGNCVSFTSLFIAMGRAVGIPVRPASMKLASEAEAQSDLWVVSTHMVAVYLKGPSVVVYDFDRGREGPPVGLTPRDDLWLNAVHLNNRGVEELVRGRPDAATEILEDAVRLAPRFAEAWGNLGVARRRSGDIEGSFDAYLIALQIQPHSHVIRGNVATLYGTLALQRAPEANPQPDSTDGLLQQGFAAMARRDVEGALKLFRRARRQAPDRVEPLVALARVKLYQGRPRAAGKRLDAALLLEPENGEARELMESIRRAGYY